MVVYDFVLENDNEIDKIYGVYANGLLTTCMSENYFLYKSDLSECGC